MPTPLPTLPGVYYSHLSCTYLGLPTGNIFTWSTGGAAPDPAGATAVATLIANSMALQWSTTMLPLYPTPVQGVDTRVYALQYPVLPAVLGHTTGTGANGVGTAAVSAAAVIRHNVTRRGRGSQSHSAISPLPFAAISTDGKSVVPGVITTLTTEFENFIGAVQADFLAAFPTDTLEYVQLSKKGAGATYPITGSFCESLLGTERSRTPRP